MLRHAGHEVAVMYDGVAALAAAQDFRPDTVILDLGMPRLDGLEAAKRLRALPGGRRMRLIAMTGWGQEADRQRTREAGFDLHLVKPATSEEIAYSLMATALPAADGSG
jgi:CheY-like chemotaxis protein